MKVRATLEYDGFVKEYEFDNFNDAHRYECVTDGRIVKIVEIYTEEYEDIII